MPGPAIPSPAPQSTAFGVLTLAYGGERFYRQAINLSRSLRLHNPGLPIAIATDLPSRPAWERYFDYVIPLRQDLPLNLVHKLHLDEYSPFSHTLFLDSDCLIIQRLDGVYTALRGHPFTTFGYKATEGWWYMQIPRMLERFSLLWMPRFNGGLYYFERGPATDALFAKARQIGRIHLRLQAYELGGWFNEEVFYALAMAFQSLVPVEDHDLAGMFTPEVEFYPFRIDAYAGACEIVRDGKVYRPAIVHFFGQLSRSYHYLREALRLRLASRGYVPAQQRRLIIAGLDKSYATLLSLYSLSRRLTGETFVYTSKDMLVPLVNFGTRISSKMLR